MAAKKARAGGLQALDHHLAHPLEKFET